ncbi:hypothetical protein CBF60_03885 [Lactobacillus taiwanensis]|uniref:DUF438 domain-containing protein n=1 Tax=Lactobacillus taiwanensis TaxID=508451 RepID=UPI000B99D1C1|nr:DUF438 domain-containing protein [Lactobacillus taiwanensis]OYS21532.1 hypothetical protein CBF76_01700 [Lactobacillus taiwanensis]OYS21977.1 hypothetical protein CBF66_08940 [Lactobacillus taiwanensis]OYS23081.1 hypothetical protein CBF55_05560 [Lactobacillus taiwanensis]OYS26225.1 hypothetical protein CBF73_03295 [Lactobacillus taiwanensis]OYS28344.1 hypothetical protein CBF60_03885 [Lactobacillus taiwanensis]
MKELDKERQKAILKILNFIQDGGELEEAKKMFQAAFDQVDVAEITAAERELIAQGLDPREIQYLCNIHADVFKGNIKENKKNPEFEKPGHPVHTFKLENIVLKSLVNDALLPDLAKWEKGDKGALSKLRQELKDLAKIHYHYARKETSMFPIMTKYGITAPPKVMWGVDDKIRKLIGQANLLINQKDIDQVEVSKAIKETAHEVLEMIFKEEEIMLPMIDEVASEEDWGNVKNEEEQIGYTLIQKPMNWKPKEKTKNDGPLSVDKLSSLALNFAEGSLNLEQLSAILDLLPFALTFIDENDKVAYFGGGANIFPHSKNAIGNSVYSCHLPESIPRVKKIFDDFHQGKKDKYEFWFQPRHMGRYLYLQYFAVRKDNKYLGCLEVAQDVTDIRSWKNEKR